MCAGVRVHEGACVCALGGPREWELGPPEKRKCALFLVICSPSVPLLYLSQILQLPQRGKPTFTVTRARGNQPSWQLCVPAERRLWQPSDQRVRSARWQEGRRHPCKGRCPFQECRPPLHQHNQLTALASQPCISVCPAAGQRAGGQELCFRPPCTGLVWS